MGTLNILSFGLYNKIESYLFLYIISNLNLNLLKTTMMPNVFTFNLFLILNN